MAVGAKFPGDPDVAEVFDAARVRVAAASEAAEVAAGIHNATGDLAAQRLANDYTFATVASDLTHLEIAAEAYLDAAQATA